MSRKFLVQYHEWENDGQAHFQDSYFYHQAIYQAFTIRDVKEFVKRKRYGIHKPVCTCFLRIYKQINKENNQIGECLDYNDSTFLNYTVFNKSNPIFVCANLGKKCSCGGLDILTLSSNFEKKREEDIKRWEEKSREDKEYYDRRLREEKGSVAFRNIFFRNVAFRNVAFRNHIVFFKNFLYFYNLSEIKNSEMQHSEMQRSEMQYIAIIALIFYLI